jgi:hypothetical protein
MCSQTLVLAVAAEHLKIVSSRHTRIVLKGKRSGELEAPSNSFPNHHCPKSQ